MSYRGLTIPLPVGQQGFTGTENPSQAGPGHLLYTDGAELDAGIIRKEGGAEKFNSSALESIDLLIKSLLHMNGTDASTTFTDSSASPHIWTAVGNAQIDTAQSKFGGASGLFDGTGDYITTPDHADFTLGSSNFTIALWFNCNAPGGVIRRICGQCDSTPTAAATSFRIQRTSGNVINASVAIGAVVTTVTGTTQFHDTLNTGWHHVAFVRIGDILRLFIDCVQEGGDVAVVGAINDSANLLAIGTTGEVTTDTWLGWIDDWSIRVGAATYTANFTPPTAEATGGLLSAVIAGINWSPVAGSLRDVVFLDGGTVLKDTGAGTFPTTMASSLSTDREPPPYFVVGGGEAVGAARRIFLFSSSNQVQTASADGNTLAAIANPAADWASSFPTFGLLHGQRMWAGGNNSDPHRMYFSSLTNHTDFLTGGGVAGSIAIYPGEGERIVGGMSFRGALVIFKYPAGIYIINTADPTVANWTVTPLTRATGTLNQNTIIPIENDVLFMDAAGSVHALSTTNEFGDLTSSDIGEVDKIQKFMQRNINLTKLRRTVGIWYAKRHQAWFAMPLLGSDNNNLRFITVFEGVAQQNTPPVRRFFMSRRDTPISMWLRPDAANIPTPAHGDDLGFVWNMDQEVRSKDGAGYPIIFETSNTDFGFADPQMATKMKGGQFLELNYEPRGDWDLTVECFWDDILTDTILFNMGSGGASIGSFILDTDVLAASSVRSKRVKMDGSGRRLRLVAENSGVGQDVSLSSFFVGTTLMDERVADQ